MTVAMKILTSLLVAAAAVSNAQTAQVQVKSSGNYSVSLEKHEVVRDGDDFDGMSLGAKARLTDSLSATLSWADASSDTFLLAPLATVEIEATRVSLGAEYELATGAGRTVLSLAYARTSAESEVGVVGDAFENNQFVLGARYEQALGAGFTAIVGATHFINDFEGQGPQAAAYEARYEDSTTSLGVTLAYEVHRNVSVHLTYATEDALLGLANADNTISFGLKASF